MSVAGYHDTRFSEDAKRDRVWSSLWRFYFSRLVDANDCVLDVGCGYGSFINQVKARSRIAVDVWPGFKAHVQPTVQAVVGNVSDLDFLPDHSVDFTFASNVFEHVTKDDFSKFLAVLKKKLTPKGTLTILQPNYRYCYREYFDDFTHITVYSHQALADFLKANSFEVIDLRPRFLPYTLKSRLPAWPFLIWVYLKLPFKPMGKQMLIRARPSRDSAESHS